MIVQNINTIFLECNPEDYELYLNKERFIADRDVNYLLAFSESNYTFNNVPLFPLSLFDDSYFNIHHSKYKSDYMKRINIGMMNVESTIKRKINATLDFDLTKIILNSQVQNKCYLPICAVYTKQSLKPLLNAYNQLSLKIIAPTAGIYKLSDFAGYQLRGKAIKQIETKQRINCYMTLRTINNDTNINNMPTNMMFRQWQKADNKILFDNIEVDTDNTTFQFETAGTLELTFKY